MLYMAQKVNHSSIDHNTCGVPPIPYNVLLGDSLKGAIRVDFIVAYTIENLAVCMPIPYWLTPIPSNMLLANSTSELAQPVNRLAPK